MRDFNYTLKPAKASECVPSALFWFHEKNSRRSLNKSLRVQIQQGRVFLDDPLLHKTRDAFVEAGGWLPTETISCVPMSEAEQDEAVRRLEAEWEHIKQIGNPKKLESFLRNYVKNGKVIRPSLRPIQCYCRGSQILNADTKLSVGGDGLEPEIINWKLPVMIIQEDLTEEEIEEISAFENTVKDKGRNTLNMFDLAMITYNQVICAGHNTGWMKRVLDLDGSKRVIALGFARLIQWDKVTNAGLRIIERINPENQYLTDEKGEIVKGDDKKPIVNPDWIDMRKFNQFVWQGPRDQNHRYYKIPLQSLIDCSLFPDENGENEELFKLNKTRMESNLPPITPLQATHKDRETLIEMLDFYNTHGAGKAKSIMEHAKIDQLKTKSVNDVTKATARAVMDRDESVLKKANQRAAAVNYIYRANEALYEAIDAAIAEVSVLDRTVEQQIELWEQFTQLVKNTPTEAKEEVTEEEVTS